MVIFWLILRCIMWVGKVLSFNDIAPDFMSLLELREIHKHLEVSINMPIRYMTPQDEYRLVIDNDSVIECLGVLEMNYF